MNGAHYRKTEGGGNADFGEFRELCKFKKSSDFSRFWKFSKFS